MSDFDFDLIDSSAQDEIAFSAPIVFWKHGKTELEQAGGVSYTGGFFFTYEQAGEQAEIPKWEESWFKGDKGKIYGLAAQGAQITIVRSRRRWFKDDGGRNIYRAWNNYTEGYRGQMQSIGFIKGYDVPVCFAFKGMLITSIEEVIRYHNSKLVSLANQSAPQGQKLPHYAMWMVVHAGKHAEIGQGNKKSEVTMPELWLPKSVDIDYARKMYVGKEQLLRSQALYHELDGWAKQWDRFTVDANDAPLGAEDYSVESETRRTMPAAPPPPPDFNDDDRGISADDIPF